MIIKICHRGVKGSKCFLGWAKRSWGSLKWGRDAAILTLASVVRLREYLLKKDGETHSGYKIPEDLGFWKCDNFTQFVNNLEGDHSRFSNLNSKLRGARWNRHLGQHLVFSFPEGTRLSDQEKMMYVEYLLGKICSRSSAFFAWHESEDGKKIHLHVFASNYVRGGFPALRIRDLKARTASTDYLPLVVEAAKNGVELLNNLRKEAAKRTPGSTLTLIKTLEQIRRERKENAGEVFRNIGLDIAVQLGFDVPDEHPRTAILNALGSTDWMVTRGSESTKTLSIIPPGKTRAKRFHWSNLEMEVEDACWDHVGKGMEIIDHDVLDEVLAKAQAAHVDEEDLAKLGTGKIDPLTIGRLDAALNSRRPEELGEDDKALPLFRIRATEQIVEIKSEKSGKIFVSNPESFRPALWRRLEVYWKKAAKKLKAAKKKLYLAAEESLVRARLIIDRDSSRLESRFANLEKLPKETIDKMAQALKFTETFERFAAWHKGEAKFKTTFARLRADLIGGANNGMVKGFELTKHPLNPGQFVVRGRNESKLFLVGKDELLYGLKNAVGETLSEPAKVRVDLPPLPDRLARILYFSKLGNRFWALIEASKSGRLGEEKTIEGLRRGFFEAARNSRSGLPVDDSSLEIHLVEENSEVLKVSDTNTAESFLIDWNELIRLWGVFSKSQKESIADKLKQSKKTEKEIDNDLS